MLFDHGHAEHAPTWQAMPARHITAHANQPITQEERDKDASLESFSWKGWRQPQCGSQTSVGGVCNCCESVMITRSEDGS